MQVTINREGNAINVRIQILTNESISNRQIMDASVPYFQSALGMLNDEESVNNIHFLINGYEVNLYK